MARDGLPADTATTRMLGKHLPTQSVDTAAGSTACITTDRLTLHANDGPQLQKMLSSDETSRSIFVYAGISIAGGVIPTRAA